MTALRQRVLDELQRRNYSPATTRCYILAIKQFAEYFGRSPEHLGAKEIREFETYLLKEKSWRREQSMDACRHCGSSIRRSETARHRL